MASPDLRFPGYRSLYGNRLGLSPYGLVVDGSPMEFGGPNRIVLFDDFLGDVVGDAWNFVETDTDATGAVLAGAIGGAFQITPGNDDANGTVLTDLAGITSYLNWQASNGGLVMQARIKASRITDAYYFVGFTDVGTIEAPIICNTAETITTNATDACGFLFDTNFTADTWHLVGVATNTDATAQILTAAPVAADYETLRIEISAAGVATFYRNGRQVGTRMTGAVTAGADLTPCIYASSLETTTPQTLDIDYVLVAMNRAIDGDAT